MKTTLAAIALALAAGSAGAVSVSDAFPRTEPAVPGPYFLTYDDATDVLSVTDLAFTTFITATIGDDGAVTPPTTPADLLVTDGFATDLASGELLDVELSAGAVTLLFSVTDLDDADADEWGPFALASFAIPGFDPVDGLRSLDDGAALEVNGSVNSAVIPLPGAAVLLAGALAALGAAGRVRR